jgi:hypothetical protein
VSFVHEHDQITTTISTEYFNHAAHYPFFSSKCRLFNNATFFGSCITHIDTQDVLKFKSKTPVPKVNVNVTDCYYY